MTPDPGGSGRKSSSTTIVSALAANVSDADEPAVPARVVSSRPKEAVMLNKGDLEKELRRWREARSRKQGGRQTPADRRTLRVNGQEVVVITKPKRALA